MTNLFDKAKTRFSFDRINIYCVIKIYLYVCVCLWKRKKSSHMNEMDRRRKEASTVNVWCHFAVRGNSGVSNIGTHISASKHLFNSHPSLDSSRPSKSWSKRDFNLPVSSPFPSLAARLFDISCERAFDGDWRNTIQSKATHRIRTDVMVPINGLEAILFPTCVRTRPFWSWSITAKNEGERIRCMHQRKSISTLI